MFGREILLQQKNGTVQNDGHGHFHHHIVKSIEEVDSGGSLCTQLCQRGTYKQCKNDDRELIAVCHGVGKNTYICKLKGY